ncbi:MAG: fibronectin type III domain-containing protein [Tepidisphaeraceae bacterium]
MWSNQQTIEASPGFTSGGVGTGYYVSLAVDSNNRAAVAFYDGANTDLKYASRDASGVWAVRSTAIETTSSLYPSLAFSTADVPFISYYLNSTDDLKVARWTGSAWSKVAVDSTDDVGRSSSIHRIPGAADRFGIAYEKTTGGDFKVAELGTDGLWTTTVVDADPLAGGGFTSLDYDASNNPAFSYYDSWTSTLKYASRSGSTWSVAGISGRISNYTNLAFDSTGKAHLVYYDVAGNIAYHISKPSGGTWQSVNPNLLLGGGNRIAAAFKSDGSIAYTFGPPNSQPNPPMGIGFQQASLATQPVLSSATTVSNSRVDVAWTFPNNLSQTGFKVGVSTDAGQTFVETIVASAAARSAQITGLSGNTTYTFTVRAYNASGDSSGSDMLNATTLQNPAADLVVQNVAVSPMARWSGARVTVTWQDTNQGDAAASVAWSDRIQVVRDADSTVVVDELLAYDPALSGTIAPGTSKARSFAFNLPDGLAGTGQFHILVTADHGNAIDERPAGEANNDGQTTLSAILAAPDAPTGLSTVFTSATQAQISWSAAANADTYVVQRRAVAGSWETVAEVPATQTQHADSNSQAGAATQYRVFASNSTGSEVSRVITTARPTADAFGLSTTLAGYTKVALAWASPTGASGFDIEISIDGTSFLREGSTAAGITSYVFSRLLTGTAFYFRVRAHQSDGSTSTSDVASTEMPAMPFTSESDYTTATELSDGQVEVRWTSHNYYPTHGPVAEHVVERQEFDQDWVAIRTVPTTTLSIIDAVSAGTVYSYRLRARYESGFEHSIAQESVVTSPVAPTGLLTAPFSDGSGFELRWDEAPGDGTHYELLRDGEVYAGYFDWSSSFDVWQDPGSTHVYSLVAKSLIISGDFYDGLESAGAAPSAPITASTTPEVASFYRTQVTGHGAVHLEWADILGEDSYHIEQSTNGTDFVEVATLGAGVTSHLMMGLDPAQIYHFRIIASNTAGGPSEASDAVQIRPTLLANLIVSDAARLGAGATATPSDTAIPEIYVAEIISGPDAGKAKIELSITTDPATPEAGENVLWTVFGIDFSVSGSFAESQPVVTLIPTEGARDFYVHAGVDHNGDGIIGADEDYRVVLVHVVRFDTLTVATAADATNSAGAADGTVQQLFVQPASDGTAVLSLSASGEAEFSPSRSRLLWKITGTEANPAFGTFESAQVVASLRRLNPTDNVFHVKAGIDTDANGVLSDSEVMRTIKVVLAYTAADLWEALEADPAHGAKFAFVRQQMSQLGHSMVIEDLILRDFDGTADAAYVDLAATTLFQAVEWATNALREWAFGGAGEEGYFTGIAHKWAEQFASDGAVAMGSTLDFLYLFSRDASGALHNSMYSAVGSGSTSLAGMFEWIFAGRFANSSPGEHDPSRVESDASLSMHPDYWDFNDPLQHHGDQNHHVAGCFMHGITLGNSNASLLIALLKTGDYPDSTNYGDYRLALMAADFAVWWQEMPASTARS